MEIMDESNAILIQDETHFVTHSWNMLVTVILTQQSMNELLKSQMLNTVAIEAFMLQVKIW